MKKIPALLILLITGSIIMATGEGSGKRTGELKQATFAGGCFWCMVTPFEKLEGVRDVVSGYTGGTKPNPTYEEVSSGTTGHLEAVQITYDPALISYEKLLEHFWKSIDPTDSGGQFVDRGGQYRSAVYYHSEEQRKTAEASKKKLAASGVFSRPVVTPILPAAPFYKAEDYHQDYHKKNPLRYKAYRYGSGRDQFLEKTWKGRTGTGGAGKSGEQKKLSREELKKKLSPLQYNVTQEGGTEPPFRNEYVDNKKEGIYVDIVSGEALFSSLDKYDSGSGWPSFMKPLEKENVRERKDSSLFMERTEVRSAQGDSHLGHVFNDGPNPTGLRYCMNSAALRFIPKEDLDREGYGRYRSLFEK